MSAILCLAYPGELHHAESRELAPAASLRAEARESRAELDRMAFDGVPVRVSLPAGSTDAQCQTAATTRLERLRAHHEGRARLFDRCADAAERVGVGAG